MLSKEVKQFVENQKIRVREFAEAQIETIELEQYRANNGNPNIWGKIWAFLDGKKTIIGTVCGAIATAAHLSGQLWIAIPFDVLATLIPIGIAGKVAKATTTYGDKGKFNWVNLLEMIIEILNWIIDKLKSQ